MWSPGTRRCRAPVNPAIVATEADNGPTDSGLPAGSVDFVLPAVAPTADFTGAPRPVTSPVIASDAVFSDLGSTPDFGPLTAVLDDQAASLPVVSVEGERHAIDLAVVAALALAVAGPRDTAPRAETTRKHPALRG
jgi:hypothetical protein